MADRFYCPNPPVDGRFRLEGDEAHHLARVRRVAPGERIELFDGRGLGYLVDVRTLGKHAVELELVEPQPAAPKPAIELTLATAVPKGDRFDWLVEKATELGVARLVPLRTERSSVDPRGSKLDRLRRAVIEACKQCGRDHLMRIDEPRDFGALLASGEGWRARYLAHPGGLPTSDWAHPGAGPVATAAVAIGPEGGFTEGEVAAAVDAGWTMIGLGTYRLRIETAALTAAALILGGAP